MKQSDTRTNHEVGLVRPSKVLLSAIEMGVFSRVGEKAR